MNTNRGVDAPTQNRPGVPMEKTPPAPVPGAPRLMKQISPRAEVLVDPTRGGRTAVYGTTLPPRGLSGLIRRAAYRLPDYRVRRWLLLLVADRIDAQEHRLRRFFPLIALGAAAALGLGVAARLRR